MRRLVLVFVIGLLFAVTSTTALAGADRTLIPFPETTETFRDDFGVCDSGPGWVTVTWKGFMTVLSNPNGVHINAHVTGTFRFVPDDPTYPAFGGHVGGQDVLNMGRGAQTTQSQFILNGKKDDGSRFHLHATSHLTATPSGHVYDVDFGRCDT